MIQIDDVKLSKSSVNVQEQFKIEVSVSEKFSNWGELKPNTWEMFKSKTWEMFKEVLTKWREENGN